MGGRDLQDVLTVVAVMLSGKPTNIHFEHPFDKYKTILFAANAITMKDPKAKIAIVSSGGYHNVSNCYEWVQIARNSGLTPPTQGRVMCITTSELLTTDLTSYSVVVIDDTTITTSNKGWVYIQGMTGTETITIERLTPTPRIQTNNIMTTNLYSRAESLAQIINAFPGVRCVVYGISPPEQAHVQKKLWMHGIKTSSPNSDSTIHRSEITDSSVRVLFCRSGGSRFKYHSFPNIIIWSGTLTTEIVTRHPHETLSVLTFKYVDPEIQSITDFLTSHSLSDAIVGIQNNELTTKKRLKSLPWPECKHPPFFCYFI